MDIIQKKISELNPYENNPRKHSRDQIDKIKESIKQFGFIVPILIDKNNTIIAGHGRLKAAQKLNLVDVPTILVSNLSDEQVRAFRIADNYLTDESKWAKDTLKLEIKSIEVGDFGFMKKLFTGIAATDIKLDSKIETDNSGGAYFQSMNKLFMQIGAISFSIKKTDETSKAIEKLRSVKDKEQIGIHIIKSILDYHG